jgi:transposase
VLLCIDWTLLRLFPPLRATWALMGTQAAVPITGTNAKRVLFGAIDLRTAHRIVLIRCHARQADAQAFLSELRRCYRRAGQIWVLADRASAHTAPQTLTVAAQLRIRFLWLPKQAPELSPMDQLWRELKRLIAANRQAESIDALADDAAAWLLTLTPQQARRKASMTSKRFWLKVSEATAPFSGLLDAQSFFAGAQCHGMSSSMRLCGQPLTSRVSRSVK